MKKISTMILLISILFGCAQSSPFRESASRIIDHISKSVKKKYGFYAASVGVGGPELLRYVSVLFEYADPLTIDEARYILVSTVGEGLEFINADEKMRPALMQYPYTFKDLEIGLFPAYELQAKVKPGVFGMFISRGGTLKFHRLNDDYSVDYKDPQTETFEEALEILKKQGRLPEYFKDKGE